MSKTSPEEFMKGLGITYTDNKSPYAKVHFINPLKRSPDRIVHEFFITHTQLIFIHGFNISLMSAPDVLRFKSAYIKFKVINHPTLPFEYYVKIHHPDLVKYLVVILTRTVDSIIGTIRFNALTSRIVRKGAVVRPTDPNFKEPIYPFPHLDK